VHQHEIDIASLGVGIRQVKNVGTVGRLRESVVVNDSKPISHKGRMVEDGVEVVDGIGLSSTRAKHEGHLNFILDCWLWLVLQAHAVYANNSDQKHQE
jgi:hypothetical protein